MTEKKAGEEMVPVDKSEFDRQVVRIDNLETKFNDMQIQQGIYNTKVDNIEKLLDKISNNVSRTFWTVVGGLVLLVINYFWNPPPPEKVEGTVQFIKTLFL